MISRVFIQEKGNGRLEPENRDLADEFSARGYAVDLFTAKILTRQRLPLDRTCLVAGDIPVIIDALKQLRLPTPAPDDYPECLQPFLRRRVWQTRLGAVRELVYRGDALPLFVKPKDRLKRFTGTVIESPHDLAPLINVSKQTPVLCSEVVRWRSEYRLFIINGNIRGVRHYHGDSSIALDEQVTKDAIDTLEQSGKAHSAYGIDFGVLDTGETALVELNDGYGLASYGLERSIYADLIFTRWMELLSDGYCGCATIKPSVDALHKRERLDRQSSGIFHHALRLYLPAYKLLILSACTGTKAITADPESFQIVPKLGRSPTRML